MKKLLKFANAVREAGGGNPLDALMPSVPQDPKRCLIAKNLNFNCEVVGHPDDNRVVVGNRWIMITTRDIRDKIAAKLGLKPIDYRDEDTSRMRYGVVLPRDIGQVASDFDRWSRATIGRWEQHGDGYTWVYMIRENASPEALKCLQDFWPYIKKSKKEGYKNATFVNKKGELVL
jgi:hypothetical protein